MQAAVLTIDEVAALLNVSRGTIRRAWYSGTIPKPFRMGRRGIRWRKAEIEQWLATRRGLDAPKEVSA